jgi:hypothetical protein
MARKSKAEYAKRAAELIDSERAYELEMDERIKTESALIRAEWCDEVRESRRVQKVGPLEIPVSHRVAGCPNGKEFE